MQNAQENHNSTPLDPLESLKIENDIIKYQFVRFCKQNTQAIALLLKALLQGAKHYPKATLEQAFLQGQSAITESKSNSATTLKASGNKDSTNGIAKTPNINGNPKNVESKATTPKPTPLNLEG